MLESTIQKQIITRLDKAGWIVDKPVTRSHKGFPDLTAYKDGTTVFIEVKRPGEKPTKIQEFWILKLRMSGFDAYVMSDWQELRKYELI